MTALAFLAGLLTGALLGAAAVVGVVVRWTWRANR